MLYELSATALAPECHRHWPADRRAPHYRGLDEILDYSATTVTRVAGDTARVQWSDAGPVERKE